MRNPRGKHNEAQAALDAAAAAQTVYWEALSELEDLIGCEVDQNQDLAGMTVEDLKELAEGD